MELLLLFLCTRIVPAHLVRFPTYSTLPKRILNKELLVLIAAAAVAECKLLVF